MQLLDRLLGTYGPNHGQNPLVRGDGSGTVQNGETPLALVRMTVEPTLESYQTAVDTHIQQTEDGQISMEQLAALHPQLFDPLGADLSASNDSTWVNPDTQLLIMLSKLYE